MSLPPSAPRKHLHTRLVRFDGYHREDGLWDIEATLTDTKAYMFRSGDKGALPPGTPIHAMVIRLTLDDALTIQAIATDMPSTPHGECGQAADPMQKMVGHTIGPGWRVTIEKNLGSIKGCTHLRELLFNMATAAYQTIPGYRAQLRREAGLPEHSTDEPPFSGQVPGLGLRWPRRVAPLSAVRGLAAAASGWRAIRHRVEPPADLGSVPISPLLLLRDIRCQSVDGEVKGVSPIPCMHRRNIMRHTSYRAWG